MCTTGLNTDKVEGENSACALCPVSLFGEQKKCECVAEGKHRPNTKKLC